MLFTAGMSLFDTIDGCFMNFAYDWAFAEPVRKVYYNLTMTGLSVVVAFFVGTIEIARPPGHRVPPARTAGTSSPASTSTPPGSSSSVFVATWVVAAAYWHLGDVEAK